MDLKLLRGKMDVKEAIKRRRSIRKYKDTLVSDEIINELLEAARLAPSAYNAQPWKFMVITEREIFKKFREEEVFTKEFIYSVPLMFVCLVVDDSYPSRSEDKFPLRDLALEDISIASQNIVLRATELGLGSCYVGVMSREKIRKVLSIPMRYIIPYVITFGYADEEPGARTLKKMDEIRF